MTSASSAPPHCLTNCSGPFSIPSFVLPVLFLVEFPTFPNAEMTVIWILSIPGSDRVSFKKKLLLESPPNFIVSDALPLDPSRRVHRPPLHAQVSAPFRWKSLGSSLLFPMPFPFCLAFSSLTLSSVLHPQILNRFPSWFCLYATQSKGSPDDSMGRSALSGVPAAIAFMPVTRFSAVFPGRAVQPQLHNTAILELLETNTSKQASSQTN